MLKSIAEKKCAVHSISISQHLPIKTRFLLFCQVWPVVFLLAYLRLSLVQLLQLASASIPANIRLGENVWRTSWKRLRRNIFFVTKMSSKRFQDVFARRFFEDVLKTSWRHLGRYLLDALEMSCKDVLKISFGDVFQTRLEDVWSYAEEIFKVSSRSLGKQEMCAGINLMFLTRNVIVKMFLRTMRRKKYKHKNIALLARSKLNSINKTKHW